ncbi:hypothetical protein A2U01_0114912, partial [Trifolium medium]|nr:hypothetical protein [Trifolium medium]
DVEVVQPKVEDKKKNQEGEGGNKKGGDGNGGDNSAKVEGTTSGYGYGSNDADASTTNVQ